MSSKIVISGDDFGISEAFSIGSLLSWRDGAVSELALMVNLPTSAGAARLRAEHAPQAPVSLHLNLVLGRPLSDPASVPSLVDDRGLFYRSFRWLPGDQGDGKCRGTVCPDADDIRRELLLQIERFRELTGAYPAHVDSHSVMVEPVREALVDICGELGIHCEGDAGTRSGALASCGECLPPGGQAARNAIIMRGSSLDDWREDAFGISACPYEIAVIHVHPGFIDQQLLDSTSLTLPRCRDFATLTDARVRDCLARHGIETVSYEAVYPHGFTEPGARDVAALIRRWGARRSEG